MESPGTAFARMAVPSSAGSGANALDADPDILGVPEHAELGDAHFCARRMEVGQDHACDPVGEILDQPEMFARDQRADVLDDAAVVDRICDLAAGEHIVAPNTDLDFQ